MSGNGPSHLIGVSSDVTDRRNAEANLRHMNETLEKRVAERTADLRRAHASVLAQIAQRVVVNARDAMLEGARYPSEWIRPKLPPAWRWLPVPTFA